MSDSTTGSERVEAIWVRSVPYGFIFSSGGRRPIRAVGSVNHYLGLSTLAENFSKVQHLSLQHFQPFWMYPGMVIKFAVLAGLRAPDMVNGALICDFLLQSVENTPLHFLDSNAIKSSKESIKNSRKWPFTVNLLDKYCSHTVWVIPMISE